MQYKAPKYLPYGTTKKGDVGWSLNKTDKKARFCSTQAVSETIAFYSQIASSYTDLIAKMIYLPEEKAIVEWYEEAGMPYAEFKNNLFGKKLSEKEIQLKRETVNNWNKETKILKDLKQ